MQKQELLKKIDNELLEKLYGFCYARTNDSYEAQDMCSDIIFALIKAANQTGEIANFYPFIWKIARNVYADFSDKRRRHSDIFYEGNSDELLSALVQEQAEDNDDELLSAVCRQISFLTRAYREVMIMLYMDGLSTAEIAKIQNISETAVRQRLFSARKKIRNEVKEMNETYNKPVVFEKKEYIIWGKGDPSWSDPRNVCTRQFSKHIIWLCHKKPMSASEIADRLNVPTVYVEEELEILAAGEYGKYGLLRELDNGRFTINFILLDKDTIEKAHAIYLEQLPDICNIVYDFIMKHKDEYLSFPYLNKKIDLNLVLWQQIFTLSGIFAENVEKLLAEKYFADVNEIDRPFSVFGYVDNGRYYGGGWDGVNAENVCGYSKIHLDNIYVTRIKPHFHCGLNIASDPQIQLALRAIHGLDVDQLSNVEKEHAAKAIECGYLYREGRTLYTKILVSDIRDMDSLYKLSRTLNDDRLHANTELIAEKISEMIHKTVPNHLLAEWKFFNSLANMPVLDGLIEFLIERGLLTPPKDGIGAEGCWMSV